MATATVSSAATLSCEAILQAHGLAVGSLASACAALAAPAHLALACGASGEWAGRVLDGDHDADASAGESDGGNFATFQTTEDWVNLGISVGCILGAALAAGLTMSVVSLEAVDLRVKVRTGTAREQQCAATLLPLVERTHPHHRLLVTLLLCNSVFNEALPLFLDQLVPSWAAVLVSVTAVLFFGEIIPSAIFTGPNKLFIAASFAGLVRCMLCALAPLAWPIAWVLDRAVPEEQPYLSRSEVRALVAVHRELAREEGLAEPFEASEEAMIQGALSLSSLTTESAHKLLPCPKCFTLSADATMGKATMRAMLDASASRVPVHAPGEPGLWLGYLLVKDHLLLDPDDEVPVASLHLYLPVAATPTLPLSKLLQAFHGSGSHMAFVAKDPALLTQALEALAKLRAATHARAAHASFGPRFADAFGLDPTPPSPHHSESEVQAEAKEQSDALAALRHCSILGLVTLEDVIEVLLAQAIYDEADRSEARRTLGRFLKGVALPVLKGRVSAAKQSDSTWRRALERTVRDDARPARSSTAAASSTSAVSAVATGPEGGRPSGSEQPTPLVSEWLLEAGNGSNSGGGDSNNRRASGGFSERNQRNSSRVSTRGLFTTSARAAPAGSGVVTGGLWPPPSGSPTEPLLSARASSRAGQYASLAGPEEQP